MDWNLFSSTLLSCAVMKRHCGLGDWIWDPNIKFLGQGVQFRCRIVAIKSTILRQDLIAVVLRIKANDPSKDAFIVGRCSIKGWDCNADLLE